METKITPFSDIYSDFLHKITDDMYLELTELDTFRLLEDLLIYAIHNFEFPRVNLYDYEVNGFEDQTVYCGADSNFVDATAFIYNEGYFKNTLTSEEINILSTYMVVAWLGQQLASIENTRMKYTGDDFKMTSQANHMQKLLTVKKEYEREGFHLQRLYKRRKVDKNGIMKSTLGSLMEIN